jgi:hypothetical protein
MSEMSLILMHISFKVGSQAESLPNTNLSLNCVSNGQYRKSTYIQTNTSNLWMTGVMMPRVHLNLRFR